MPCYQQNNQPQPSSGLANVGVGPFATEAECLEACKEGACCNGTTCSIKPQCQCDAAAGEVFKGVGTVCSPNPCLRYCSNGGFASVVGALSRKCDFLGSSGPSAAKVATGYTCPTQAGDVSPCCPQNSPELAPLYSTKNFNPTAADCMCCYESEVEPGGFLAQKSQAPSSVTLAISGTNSATLNGTWVLSSTASLGADLSGFVPVACANFVFPTSTVAIGQTPCQSLNPDNLFCGPVVANPELVVDIRLRGDSFSISGNSLIVNVNDYFPTKNAFTNAPCGCGNANYGVSVSEMRAALSSAFGLQNPTPDGVQYAFQRWLCGSAYSGISISGVLRNIRRSSGEYFADDGVWVLSR